MAKRENSLEPLPDSGHKGPRRKLCSSPLNWRYYAAVENPEWDILRQWMVPNRSASRYGGLLCGFIVLGERPAIYGL